MMISIAETQAMKSRKLLVVIQLVNGGDIIKTYMLLTSKPMTWGVSMNSTIT